MFLHDIIERCLHLSWVILSQTTTKCSSWARRFFCCAWVRLETPCSLPSTFRKTCSCIKWEMVSTDFSGELGYWWYVYELLLIWAWVLSLVFKLFPLVVLQVTNSVHQQQQTSPGRIWQTTCVAGWACTLNIWCTTVTTCCSTWARFTGGLHVL